MIFCIAIAIITGGAMTVSSCYDENFNQENPSGKPFASDEESEETYLLTDSEQFSDDATEVDSDSGSSDSESDSDGNSDSNSDSNGSSDSGSGFWTDFH